ncbi:MAG TPA: DUF4013 domain-containing protein [Pyrinomonadaceae bacterium]|nr:DUF4013 domain-containing protein [Pyrinomonadaceae bacterium]
MSAQPEVWRVSTVEGIFETDLETLKQWIAEGCVLPSDKVSKGTLNWIDAGRAPMLRAAFAGDFSPQPPRQPVYPEAVGGWQTPPPFEDTPQTPPTLQPAPSYESTGYTPPPTNHGNAPSANTCQKHPETAAHFICRMCNATWCEACPRFVSGKIPLCPSCGDLCKLYTEVTTKAAQSEFQASGFGIADFFRAIRYPFQHKLALVCGAMLYSLLLLAGLKGTFIAWMIMFGCISHVISQVAWGRLHRSFMPDFSAFSLWDDLVVPVFLGLGITIVTWGPLIALVIALLFGVLKGPGVPGMMPGQEIAAATETSAPTAEGLDVLTDPNADPKKLEEANKKLNKLRPGSQIAQEAERSQKENEPGAAVSMLLPYLGAGILLILLVLLTLGWAFFYYPMALTVAGYTQSFGAVINPLVGLDTIRRMRSTYFKAFAMVVAVQIVAFVVTVIIGVITSPFNLPFVGNLPANFINGTATFYFNLVIACVLGLSLYKCADRLGITVD